MLDYQEDTVIIKRIFVFCIFFILLISACSTSPQTVAPTTPAVSATDKVEPAIAQPALTIAPTESPILPTATSVSKATSEVKPISTAFPEGVFFRDDFVRELQPGWTWENENKDRWSITDDGKLQIIGEGDYLLKNGHQNNLLWHGLPEGDFRIDTHIFADPKENFQQAAIFLFENPENYVTINRGFCGPCGGSGIYMDYKISGDWGNYHVSTTKTDLYLRLESKNKTISGYYAIEPEKWIRLGRVGNFFKFSKAGLGISNAGSKNFDLVARYDWFEISKAK